MPVRSGAQPSQPICLPCQHQADSAVSPYEEPHETLPAADRNHRRAASAYSPWRKYTSSTRPDTSDRTARSERLNAAVSRPAVACFAGHRPDVARPRPGLAAPGLVAACACAVIGRLCISRSRVASRRCAPAPAGAQLFSRRRMSASIAPVACACANCATACGPVPCAAEIAAFALSRAAASRIASSVNADRPLSPAPARHVQRGDPARLRRGDQHRLAFT